MADLVFRNVPYGNGTVIVKDSWPDGIRQQWLSALAGYRPDEPPFMPTFEPQAFSESPNSPPMPLKIEDYATESTAYELARRFGASVSEIGLAYSTSKQRWLVWPDGTAVVAGRLAEFFINDPEDRFPHYAENFCWRMIANQRAWGIKLPPSVTPASGMAV